MDKQQWTKIGLEIEKHLREIRRIAKCSGLDCVSMASFHEGNSWAIYIEESKGDHYEVNINSDGATELMLNHDVYYTKS